MRAVVGGAVAGSAIAFLILIAGPVGAAQVALVGAVLAVLVGCIDYVQRHG